jgi:hypothetical protein
LTKKTGLFLLLVWLALLWILFLMFQQQPLTKEYHTGTYLLALVEVLAIFWVATAVGSRALSALGLDGSGLAAPCAVGLVLVGIATLGLASLGILKQLVIWPLVAAVAGMSFRQMTSVLRRLGSISVSALGPVEVLIVCLVVFSIAVCLVNCLAPATANDALVYHLSLPKSYAAAGGLTELPYNVYANMPHYGEMLYTFFYCLAGEAGARLFYFFLILGAGGAVYHLARRFVERRFALTAACIFLAQPLMLDHRIVCNIDVMLAYFFVCAVILAFDVADHAARWRSVLPVSLIAGFMLGMKYTAIAPCLGLLAALAASARRLPYRTIVIGVVMTAAVFIPWALRNEVNVGNPFYPLFEKTFDGHNWDAAQGSQLVAWQRSMGMGRSASDYLLLPLNLSTKAKPGMNYSRFDGTITPVILILLPLALIRRHRHNLALMLVAGIGFVFWTLTSQQLRFLIPTLAILAVIGSIGLGNISKYISERWIRVVLVLVILIQVSALLVPDQYGRPIIGSAFGDRLGVVTGTETERDYLRRTVQPVSMFEHVNRTVPADRAVFMVWENRGYYLERPYFADSFFEASTLMRIVSRAGSAPALRRTIEGMGFRYFIVNDLLGEVFSRSYSQRDIGILRDFIGTYLEPIHTSNRMTLYVMKTD